MKRLEEYVLQRQGRAGIMVSAQEQKEVGGDALHGKQNDACETLEHHQFVKGAVAFIGEQKDGTDTVKLSQEDRQQLREKEQNVNMILHGEARRLFVDLPSPYPLRLSIFKCFWVLISTSSGKKGAEKVYDSVRQGLATAFIFLYTKLKEPSSGKLSSIFNRGRIEDSRMVLPWAAIGLFHHSHREAYSGTDVKITYALFCCTAVLEFYSLCFDGYVASKRGKKSFSFYVGEKEKRPGMVAQYNLMGYFAHEKNNRNKVWIASKCGCKDFLDQHWCMKPCFSSDRLTELVLEYLKEYLKAGWKEEIIHDPVSYRKFNDNRGQRALECYKDELGWSIKGPFDESVLLWHIATDICFLSSPYSEHIKVCASAEVPSTRDILIEFLRFFISPLIPARTKKYQCSQGLECKAVQCMQMSNYMMYLLFVNPEMLLPGTRSNLFTTAYNELKDILGDNNLNPQRSCCGCCQQVLDKGLMETLRERDRSNDRENFIDKAWDLAQVLLNMSDDKMWKVIQGVWVEMLCFSASRCRGYLHAKALGSGGEFLSYVWLLIFYMGMETFSERLQREELPSREANNSGAPRTSNATISSTSMVNISLAPSTENYIIGEELV